MPVITEIKLQKSKTRANIFIDHNFCCGLNLNVIFQHKLKEGVEISEAELLGIQTESEANEVMEKALSLLERQKYSCSRLKAKLKEKGYMEQLIDNTIEKLKSYGYVNDFDYVRSYVTSNPNKSKREVEKSLLARGIQRDVVEQYFYSLEEPVDEQLKCDSQAEKYMRRKEKNEAVAKKLLQHLLYKGFSFEQAKNSVKKFTKEEFDAYD